MSWLGLDIGGANLKVADGDCFALSRSFPLWKRPHQLAHELRALIAEAPASDHLAATMTGELADCFESRSAGVAAIVDALEQAADGRHTRIYLTNGKLVTPEVARRQPLRAAASNWHALGRFTARFVPKGQVGLLVDVGSTTTDLIPLSPDGPQSTGETDTARLAHGELLYSGVRRSPICAVLSEAPYRDARLPVAQELFATMQDAYLILGQLPEDPNSLRTADGRPATKRHARARLARMICADQEIFHHRDAIRMAQAAASAQQDQLRQCLQRLQAGRELSPDVVVTSGSGEFLAVEVLEQLEWNARRVSLRDELGPQASRCAPAYAVATLAREGSRQ